MPTLNGEQLLTALAERHILLSGEEGKLRFRAPEGVLDDVLKEALRTQKDALVSNLRLHRGYVQLAPLSHNQLSLFFLNLFEPQAPAYNLALTLRLRTPADPAKLREAVLRLVNQHPQLRTTFSHITLGDHATPCQFVAEEFAPAFIEHDARSWSAEDLKRRAQDAYAAPINLEHGPVVRSNLFLGAKGGDVFILQMHHIAVDGWSLNILARDLGRHYKAVITGTTGDDGSQTGSYTDFAVTQRRQLAEPEGKAQMEFWRAALLPPPPPLDLGDKTRRPAIRRSVGSTQYFEINATNRTRIEAAANQLGITAFAWLLAAFQAFLMRRGRLSDVSIGIPTLGRRGVDSEKIVGYFVNPVALRCRRPASLTFREHAQRTAQEMSAALECRDLPLTALVENLGGTRDLSRTPAFQVLFNLLTRRVLGDVVDMLYPGAEETTVNLGGGLAAGAYPLDQQEGQFDLTLELVERGSSWIGLLKYCTDLFTPAEANRMQADFISLLETVIADPDRLLSIDDRSAASSTPTDAGQRRQFAIAATFTAEPMQETFDFWFERLGWQADVAFAPFNQVFQELINPASLLRRNSHGVNFIFLRLDDLIDLSAPAGNHAAVARLQSNLEELAFTLQSTTPLLRAPLCVVVCPPSPRLSQSIPESDAMQASLINQLQNIPGLHVLTPEVISRWYPVADWYEPAGEEIGHIPYTPKYLSSLATSAIRLTNSLNQKPVKALVVDCDGTLWDGVVGEDGPEGIKVGPEQKKFQEFLLKQHRAGVLLCLCSKNQEADVWTVFDRHPAMVLKREHVAFARINWLQKSANLQSLAAEINIGLNAIAFLDDNALERAEVRSGCPAVLCPDLPVAWEARVPFLRNLWPLDRLRTTAEDQKRSEHYRTERLRAELRKEAGSYADFLDNLELAVESVPASSGDIDRLAQLTIRTNQFNTTVRRLTVAEVASYVGQTDRSAFVTRVRDKFGDYGLVGAAFTQKQGDSLTVDPLLLSCRALGRGVEHRIVAQLGAHAVAKGCHWVDFPLNPTERNEPARTFLTALEESCAGTRNANGTLRVAATRLEAVRFTQAEVTVTAKTEPQDTSHSLLAAATWDTRVANIARDFPSSDDIFEALTNWRQQRHARSGPQPLPAANNAPLSDVERAISTAWKKVLALNEIGANENFFEVGGTSILAAQLAVELRRQELNVSIVDLFHYPTIKGLAHSLSGKTTAITETAPNPDTQPQQPAHQSSRLPSPFERLRRFRGK